MPKSIVALVAIVILSCCHDVVMVQAGESPAIQKSEENSASQQSEHYRKPVRLNGVSIDIPAYYWKGSVLDVGNGLVEPVGKISDAKDGDAEKEFVDAKVAEVVTYIADHYDINIVVGYAFSDTITVDLNGLSWFESLARVSQASRLYVCPMDGVMLLTDLNAADCPLAYSGERLSFNFLDISTRSIFSLLSQFSGLPIAVCDPFDSKIFVRLKNVRWDQAFDAVLVASKLVVSRVNNTLLVSRREDDLGSCNDFTIV